MDKGKPFAEEWKERMAKELAEMSNSDIWDEEADMRWARGVVKYLTEHGLCGPPQEERPRRKELFFSRMEQLVEALADLEHEQWIHWAQAVKEEVSEERRGRWEEFFKPYSQLPHEVKHHDRVWAKKVIEALERDGWLKLPRDFDVVEAEMVGGWNGGNDFPVRVDLVDGTVTVTYGGVEVTEQADPLYSTAAARALLKALDQYAVETAERSDADELSWSLLAQGFRTAGNNIARLIEDAGQLLADTGTSILRRR